MQLQAAANETVSRRGEHSRASCRLRNSQPRFSTLLISCHGKPADYRVFVIPGREGNGKN